MTDTLTAAFTERAVDPDTVHHCLRYYLGERFDDRTADEMRDTLTAVYGDGVHDALAEIAADPLLLENAALHVLSGAWSEPSEQDRILRIAADAKAKLPVIEVAIIATAAMYGLYLLRTGGIKRNERTTIRRKDGSFEETVITEYTDPAGPLAILTRFVNRTLPPP